MSYLDFTSAMSESRSWQRADDEEALIEKIDKHNYLVTLPGGDTHYCTYATERGGYVGTCDCKGYKYGDICAHLCTLRKAEFVGEEGIGGGEIKAEPRHLNDTEPEIRADGGVDHAAGSDGETFGRPDQRL